MFLALDVAFLASLIGLPFAPFALGQAIIDVLPGFVSIPLIETLQYWAKGLLVVGVLVLFFISGATAGHRAQARPVRSGGGRGSLGRRGHARTAVRAAAHRLRDQPHRCRGRDRGEQPRPRVPRAGFALERPGTRAPAPPCAHDRRGDRRARRDRRAAALARARRRRSADRRRRAERAKARAARDDPERRRGHRRARRYDPAHHRERRPLHRGHDAGEATRRPRVMEARGHG